MANEPRRSGRGFVFDGAFFLLTPGAGAGPCDAIAAAQHMQDDCGPGGGEVGDEAGIRGYWPDGADRGGDPTEAC